MFYYFIGFYRCLLVEIWRCCFVKYLHYLLTSHAPMPVELICEIKKKTKQRPVDVFKIWIHFRKKMDLYQCCFQEWTDYISLSTSTTGLELKSAFKVTSRKGVLSMVLLLHSPKSLNRFIFVNINKCYDVCVTETSSLFDFSMDKAIECFFM